MRRGSGAASWGPASGLRAEDEVADVVLLVAGAAGAGGGCCARRKRGRRQRKRSAGGEAMRSTALDTSSSNSRSGVSGKYSYTIILL